jgi:hypothetical protein
MHQSKPHRETRFQKSQIKIDTQKCLISIIWSVNEIHSLLNGPKDIAYNSAFFCDFVVLDFVKSICAHSQRKRLKCIIVHLDNARPHNSRKSIECLEQFCTRRVSHPAYGQDLTPSDFFLFGFVKLKLPGLTIGNREGLICEIRRIFEEILKITLISIYASWIKRIK